jgi:hypothetical protein
MWTETTIDWTTVSKNESKGNVVIVGLSPGEEKQFQLKKPLIFTTPRTRVE